MFSQSRVITSGNLSANHSSSYLSGVSSVSMNFVSAVCTSSCSFFNEQNPFIFANIFSTSMLPIQGATIKAHVVLPPRIYFNPRSPYRERHNAVLIIKININFNPRSPYRERLVLYKWLISMRNLRTAYRINRLSKTATQRKLIKIRFEKSRIHDK